MTTTATLTADWREALQSYRDADFGQQWKGEFTHLQLDVAKVGAQVGYKQSNRNGDSYFAVATYDGSEVTEIRCEHRHSTAEAAQKCVGKTLKRAQAIISDPTFHCAVIATNDGRPMVSLEWGAERPYSANRSPGLENEMVVTL